MKLDRRAFLRGVLGTSGTALLGQVAGRDAASASAREMGMRGLPPPGESGIQHVVVVMMENRSFDHFWGWLPNADGRQVGLSYPDRAGEIHETYPLAPNFTGCGHPDPDHSHGGGRVQYNAGAMDGFLRSGANDEYAIGFYVEEDRPFLSALARNYATLDRYFCSILAPTYPNRFFQHAAQTDRISNTLALATMPTIWDRLAAARVSRRYYYSNLPFLGLWGLRYLPISRTYPQFLQDAAAGTLPAVSFVEPRFTVSGGGTGTDDHPHAHIGRGDAFLAEAFHAVANGPGWAGTVFIVNYDEWGGFFEHVAPPRAIAPNAVDPDLVDGRALLGFRVPAIVASPFSRGNPDDPSVNGLVFDHTSVLKLIEWRFGLRPLTARDASDDIENLAQVLDFENPRPEVPELPQPAMPPPEPCGLGKGSPATRYDWAALRDSGLLDGWKLED